MTKKKQQNLINTKSENKTEVLTEQQPKRYWYGKYMDIFSFQYWKEYYKKNFKKRSIVIAVFLLNNGKYDMVTIVDENGYFKYKNKTYVIDVSFMREDVNTGLNMLFYYEGVSIPLFLEVDTKKIVNAVGSTHADVVSALNPASLQSFIKSEVIKQLIEGGDITQEIKNLKLLIFIVLGITGVTAYLVLKMGGYI